MKNNAEIRHFAVFMTAFSRLNDLFSNMEMTIQYNIVEIILI